MATGAWITQITWSAPVDNLTNITISYRENCFFYSGNVCTVELDENPANSYSADNTYGSGCLNIGDLIPASDSWTENSLSGTYDEATYKLILFNKGTVEDTWTITFNSPTTFSCTGVNEGNVGNGSINANFTPVNQNTGVPFFTLNKNGFGGSWQPGDSIMFKTHPASAALWLKQTVPALITQEAYNLCVLGYYCE